MRLRRYSQVCARHRLRLNHWGAEDCRRLLKRDAMFFKVGNRLRDIPRKHIHVYTLIRSPVARTEDAADLFGLSGWPDRQLHQANQRDQVE